MFISSVNSFTTKDAVWCPNKMSFYRPAITFILHFSSQCASIEKVMLLWAQLQIFWGLLRLLCNCTRKFYCKKMLLNYYGLFGIVSMCKRKRGCLPGWFFATSLPTMCMHILCTILKTERKTNNYRYST